MTRRLVLVGAGLAHLQVLRAWRRRPLAGVELVVVAPEAHYYSGMVPGFLHGAYDPAQLRIDVAALARCAGARHLPTVATRISAADRTVWTDDERLEFEACSLDVGSATAGGPVPGVHEHAIGMRPMSRALELRDRVDALIAAGRPFAVVVAGAGAGGVELAFAIRRRITAAGASGAVTLTDASATVMPDERDAVRARLTALLGQRGVGIVLGSAVRSVSDRAVTLASGAVLDADVVVWATGSAPPPLLAASDLPLDERGYLRVDRRLRAADGASVWGAGDCVSLAGSPALPRSGAYAVRQGPVLFRNLRAALGAGHARRYHPRTRSLVLLDTADGRALARWGGMQAYGRWAWWLKRRIDRRFVARFSEPCDEMRVSGS